MTDDFGQSIQASCREVDPAQVIAVARLAIQQPEQRERYRHTPVSTLGVYSMSLRLSTLDTYPFAVLTRSRCCSRSCAASSISLCRHSEARYTQAMRPVRWTRRKSP